MYKKIHFYLIFLFSLFFAHFANASGFNCCDKEEMQSELVHLSLSPSITKNAELLSDIELEYGQEFVIQLKKDHPILEKKTKGKIDSKTLKWIENTGFSDKSSPGMRFVFSPFNTTKNEFGAHVLMETLLPEIYPIFRAMPLFYSENQLEALKEVFKKNNYRVIFHFLKKSFQLSEDKALEVSKELYSTLFDKTNYIFVKDIEKINNHNLIIAGYIVSDNNIISDNNIHLNYNDVVLILKKIEIPNNVNIVLKHSYAGSGSFPLKTDKSTSELKKLFENGSFESILGDSKDSYAYKFSKETYSMLSQFNGNIIAYNGDISFNYGKGYFRDPKNKINLILGETLPVSIKNKTGNLISFDKSGMRVSYSRSHFLRN